MRKKINIILGIVSVISFFIAVKLSSLPTPLFVPDYIIKIFYTSEEIRNDFAFIYDISMGFFLSYVFYFIIEILPEYFRNRSGKKRIQNDWNYLLQQMEVIISITLGALSIDKKIDRIQQVDLILMDNKIIPPDKEFYYITSEMQLNGQKLNSIINPNLFNDLIRNRINIIIDKINKIRMYEYFYTSDNHFIDLLLTIENSVFIRLYRKDLQENKSAFENKCFIYSSSSNAFYEFVILYLKAIKLKYHSKYTISKLLSDEEIKEYNQRRKAIINEVNDALNLEK